MKTCCIQKCNKEMVYEISISICGLKGVVQVCEECYNKLNIGQTTITNLTSSPVQSTELTIISLLQEIRDSLKNIPQAIPLIHPATSHTTTTKRNNINGQS